MKEIDGSSALLLGYGIEAQSTHRYLKTNYRDLAIGIADRDTTIEPIFETEKTYLGENYLAHLAEFDIIVRSPGVPLKTPELQQAMAEGARLTSAVNIFFSECPGVVVGVTGTKGKSTASALIESILSKKYKDVRLVGNIGKPALDYLPNSNGESIFVAELSSYQLEDIRYSPPYAVLLDIKQEHLDHHGSFEEYVKAKQKIVEHQGKDGHVIFNKDDDFNKSLVQSIESQRVTFSTEDNGEASTYVKNGKIYCRFSVANSEKTIEIMNVSDISLLGKGNLQNVLAAITVGMLFDVLPSDIRRAVKEFKALDHRLQYIGEKNGIRFYDDSLATIPEAVINALEALGQDVTTLIAGGFDRGISFEEFGEYLACSGLQNLILFPTTGDKIWTEVEQHKKEKKLPQKFYVHTMKEAVEIALANTPPGKICLLSPASPSFGIFKDYADRGNQFKGLLGLGD